MSDILRLLCRAMATEPIARNFVTEFSEEISAVPQAVYLAATIQDFAKKSKVVTTPERNAGAALYRVIRDAFEITLKSTTTPNATTTTTAIPPVPIGTKVTRCPTTDENGRVPKAARTKAGPARSSVDSPRATIALPPVKVTVVPEEKRPAARMAFFADARRVSLTQTGITDDADLIMRTDFNAVKLLAEGLDPSHVMKVHRDIVAETPEGLRVLTEYEHHQIGASAALDIARRVVMCAHRGQPFDPSTLERHWDAYPPPGTCTNEHRAARAAAQVRANAAIRNGRGWLALPDTGAPIRYPVKGWDRLNTTGE